MPKHKRHQPGEGPQDQRQHERVDWKKHDKHKQIGTGDGDSAASSQIVELTTLRDRLMDALEADPDLAQQVTEVSKVEDDCFLVQLSNNQKFIVGVHEDRR